MKESKDPPCKMVILGAPGVGKTALTTRLLTKRFIGEYCPTLENIYEHTMHVDDEDVKIEVLDTAGDYGLLGGLKESYALWGDCFVFVYSITDWRSYSMLTRVKQQVEDARKSTDYSMMVVGNKSDLSHIRQVSKFKGHNLAEEFECEFHEVSAYDGSQVKAITDMFKELYHDYKRKKIYLNSRQRRGSSSQKFKQAIQKVIVGKMMNSRSGK